MWDFETVLARSRQILHARIDERARSLLLGYPLPLTPFDPLPLPSLPPVQRSARRRKLSDGQSLGQILDRVEEAFESAMLPTNSTMTSRDTLAALRKMGPWVPFGAWNSIEQDEATASVFTVPMKWPGLIFMSRGDESQWKDGFEVSKGEKYGIMAFAYAVRIDALPFGVERTKGSVRYEFGIAYRRKKRLDWICAHVNIDPDSREVFVSREVMYHYVTLTRGKNKGESFMRKSFEIPALEGLVADSVAERRLMLARNFVNTLEWWLKRDQRWTVSLKRGGKRVTFSIEQSLTKTFFADRSKEVTIAGGRKKKIIHYVRSHERLLASGTTATVREHIRGVRDFSWRGFDCAVTAPSFHRFTLEAWHAPGFDAERFPDRAGIPLSRVAGILADLEDSQVPPPRLPEKKGKA